MTTVHHANAMIRGVFTASRWFTPTPATPNTPQPGSSGRATTRWVLVCPQPRRSSPHHPRSPTMTAHTALHRLADTLALIVAAVALALLLTLGLQPWNTVTLGAGGGGNSNNTPADVIHPNIHANNGPGNNANPNGANDGGGNMHGIANNPGQSGTNPNDDGTNGFANQLETVHGGIGEVNPNAG